MPFYIVLAKGGHVGRAHYMPVNLPIEAEDGREAAYKARFSPRIKHHYPDAILRVDEVSFEEYLDQKARNINDPYFLCKSRHEQDEIWDLIKDRICEEPNYERGGKSNKYKNRKPNLLVQSRKYSYEY